MKRVLLIFLVLITAIRAQALTYPYYVAQNAIGAGTGADAADAAAIGGAGFTTAGNWVAGADFELCGTITSYWQVLGSGSAGNPIVVHFQNNAQMSNTVWAGFGGAYCGIYGDGVHDVTLDGGQNGALYATGQISGQGEGCQGVVFVNPVRITIKNLAVTNMMQRTSLTDTAAYGVGIVFNGSGVGASNVVDNCLLHDEQGGVLVAYGANWHDVTITRCTITNCNHGIEIGDSDTSCSMAGIIVASNIVNSAGNWDDHTGDDTYHHDFIFIYAANGETAETNSRCYANRIGPGFGGAAYAGTGGITRQYNLFGTHQDYDNIFLSTDSNPAEGLEYFDVNYGSVFGVFNNTFYGASSDGVAINVNGPESAVSPSVLMLATNNVSYDVGTAIYVSYGTYYGQWVNYNDWYGLNSSEGFSVSSGDSPVFKTFAGWQSAFGQDANSLTSNPNLSATTYIPSAAITGANNAVAGYSADATGNSFSTYGWQMGALAYTGSAPPSSPTITVIVAGNSPLNITVTNTTQTLQIQ